MASTTGTLYIGMTNDLLRRVDEHKAGRVPGFTARYKVNKLVYCESTDDVHAAIAREKQLKGWVRRKKLALVWQENPGFRDLSLDWTEAGDPSPDAG
ncbi:MAG: GIY-YIG nuclease family protein [Dehalococcoidia bacterium]|nr:GIY-YIG nuclease family protein [Dehalococcoidia bacterium]